MSSAFPALIGNLTLVDLLLLLATLVVIPLGLRLVPFTGYHAREVLTVARIAQPAGAAAAVVSFLIPVGWNAGALALGWLAICAIASLAGLIELLERRSIRPSTLVPVAAVTYLSVGAAWLVASRAGLRPLGFSRDIVELTGVHFHYAGFGATLMAALTVMVLRDHGRIGPLASTAALLIVAGVPITAAGIATGSGLLTILGPVLLASGVLGIAGMTAMAIAPRLESAAARWLLWFSAFSVVIPMLLAVDYAISRLLPVPALDLRAMALIHGSLNAVAFSLAGLIGWTLALDKRSPDFRSIIDNLS